MGISVKDDFDQSVIAADGPIYGKATIEKLQTQLRTLEKETSKKIDDLEDENKDLKNLKSQLDKQIEYLNKRYDTLEKDNSILFKRCQDQEMKLLVVKGTLADTPSLRRKSSED